MRSMTLDDLELLLKNVAKFSWNFTTFFVTLVVFWCYSQLALHRVIADDHQLNYKRPRPLCYSEQSGQLFVVFDRDRESLPSSRDRGGGV